MLLESKVIAGKTPVGTRIQAKLCAATLVNGTVIPRNAVFSGEVTQSIAKTATDPSRLGILMDSVQWKDGTAIGSTSMKAYLTAWYYPTISANGNQNLQYGPEQPTKKTWNGMGQYPDPHSPSYTPFPNASSDQGSNVPNTPPSTTSNHRVVMKDVASEVTSEGTVTIVSSKMDIKLDKLTTYVLATVSMQPAPARPATTK